MKDNTDLKVAVVGPGAVGCLLAHRLSCAGCDVTLIDYRGDRAARISRKGVVVVTGEDREISFPACTSDTSVAGIQDVVIFAVKAFQTEDAAASALSMIGSNSLVVTLQNGMGYEEYLQKLAGRNHLVTGITALGATLTGEGQVLLAGSGSTFLGFQVPPDDDAMLVFRRLAHAFSEAGWDITPVHDPEPVRWKKLLANVGINAITAVTCIHNGEILEYAEAQKLQERAVREAFTVMQHDCPAAEYEFDDIKGNVLDICRLTSANISSMLQDRIRGGRTEIEYINGFVCRRAAVYGIDAPVNSTLLQLVRIMTDTGWRRCRDLKCGSDS